MNKKDFKHFVFFLLLVFGGNFILKAFNVPGHSLPIIVLPLLYSCYYLAKAIFCLLRNKYSESFVVFLSALLVLIVPVKIQFEYYNVFFFGFLIFISVAFLKGKTISPDFRPAVVTFSLLILLNIILILIPNNLVTTYLNNQYLSWRPNLIWSDFKGQPEPTQKSVSFIDSNLRWKLNKVFNYPAGTVIAIMDQSKSYKRIAPPDVDPDFLKWVNRYSLKHEKTHFNITEFYSRKANEQLGSKWPLRETEAKIILEQIFEEYNHEDKLYDSITHHGLDTIQQINWTKKYRL